jgi:ribonucleoside-diphosphate reductase alpha chain
MQAAWQANIDSAISKTINLPHDCSVDDVREVYELAYRLECKGITVYRDGSRAEQVLTAGSSSATTPASEEKIEPVPVMIPKVLASKSIQATTPLGKLRIFINYLDSGEPFEVFLFIGRAGSDITAFTEAIGRLISIALRNGVSISQIIDQLQGIGGSSSVGFGPNRTLSVPDAIAKALAAHGTSVETSTEGDILNIWLSPSESEPVVHKYSGNICPDCLQASLVAVEGCLKCMSCGYSAC